MVLFNYSTKELTAKIVYYGPGLCGKTTNLQYIFDNLPASIHKGKMLSLATKTDRTLFFDFLPIDLGTIRGMRTRLQLYTVPGQVFYNTTRKLVLKGADGLVFVADSQKKMLDANTESFSNLEQNLREHGMELETIPHVLQFNKRDLKDILTVEEMNASLNRHNVPIYEAVATTGIGVQDTLKAVTRLVLNSLREKYSEGKKAPAHRAAAAASASRPSRPAAAALPPAEAEPMEVEPILELDDEPAPAPAGTPEAVVAMAAEDVVEVEDFREESDPVPILEVTEEEVEEAEAVEDASSVSMDDATPLAIEEPEAAAPRGLDALEIAAEEPSPTPPLEAPFEEAEALDGAAAEEDAGLVMDSGAYEIPSPLEESAGEGATVAIDVAAAGGRPPAAGVRARPGPAERSAAREASFPLEVDVEGRSVRLLITISVRVAKG